MAIAAKAEHQVGQVLDRAARYLAYAGGVILALVSLITVASIIGRALLSINSWFGPIKGDFEIVEMGVAIAIFAFMPLAQIRRGHVTVDVFISRLSSRAQAFLGLIGDSLIALASGVILWRFWIGFGEKFPYGSDQLRAAFGMGSKPFFPETTYELEVPVWIPYSLALVGAAFFFIISLYTIWRSLNWTLDGREYPV